MCSNYHCIALHVYHSVQLEKVARHVAGPKRPPLMLEEWPEDDVNSRRSKVEDSPKGEE